MSSLKIACSKVGLFSLLLFLGCALLTGCFPPRPSAQCRSFYDLAFAEREKKIRASSPKEQIDLYYCGMYQEPPTDFADVIADQGTTVVPALLERLQTENSDTRKDFLLHIFERMAAKGDLRGNHRVIEQLRSVVSAMKDERLKNSSQQRLRAIEERV